MIDRNEPELALQHLNRISAVPVHLEQYYGQIRGVALLRAGKEPALAAASIARAGATDSATIAVLALAQLKAGDRDPAIRTLIPICPGMSEDRPVEGWIRCVDEEYCGDVLNERLEILRLLPPTTKRAVADEILLETARVHLRHGQCGDAELLSAVDAVASRNPQSCRPRLLTGLLRVCPEAMATDDACAAFERAAACRLEGRDDGWPAPNGALFDPDTMARLDLETIDRLIDFYRARFCGAS